MSRRRMGNSSFSMETFFAYAFLSDLCHVMCWVLKPGGLFRGISPSCTGRLTSVCHAEDFVRLGPSNQSGPVTTSDVTCWDPTRTDVSISAQNLTANGTLGRHMQRMNE